MEFANFVDWFLGRTPDGEETRQPLFSTWQSRAYTLFERPATEAAKENYQLREDLEKARIRTLPAVYIATVWLNTIVSIVVGVASLVALLVVLNLLGLALPFPLDLVVYLVPLLAPVGTYVGGMVTPSAKASSRRKRLDWKLPYAANFVAAMAAANATPEKIFKSLAEQEDIYGEVSREAAWLYRDIEILGKDTLTAMKDAVKRSPSDKWNDFLQGIVSTMTSGGNLKIYFLSRAEDMMKGLRRETKDFLEGLALLGETYVVVAVAMPLFLIVMMSIMMWISAQGAGADSLFVLIVFVMLPVIHTAYATAIYTSAPEE